MELRSGDTIVSCDRANLERGAYCKCGQVAFRLVTIQSLDGNHRIEGLCGSHYLEACPAYPEIRSTIRRVS
jgi:hypothetical protein